MHPPDPAASPSVKRAIALAASALMTLSLAAAAPPTVTATADPALDEIFKPQPRGFLGADGAASLEIAPGRTLWIFGDTIIGNLRAGKREGSMVRNSIAILHQQDGIPARPEYYWDLTDGIPGEFFHPESFSDTHWYWPGTGIPLNGKLYLFLSKMSHGDGPDAFAFQTIGCTLFRVQNPQDSPRAWKMTRTELALGNDHFNINAAVIRQSDYLYLLGYDDGPTANPMKRAAILSRILLSALDHDNPAASLQFWSRSAQWQSTPENLQPLFTPGPTETALHHDPATGRYMALTLEPFTPHILLVSAESMTGPWSDPQPVYTIPEVAASNGAWHAYTTRLHPELSTNPARIPFTYVVNTKDFWSMFTALDIYYPRFANLNIDPPKGKDR